MIGHRMAGRALLLQMSNEQPKLCLILTLTLKLVSRLYFQQVLINQSTNPLKWLTRIPSSITSSSPITPLLTRFTPQHRVRKANRFLGINNDTLLLSISRQQLQTASSGRRVAFRMGTERASHAVWIVPRRSSSTSTHSAPISGDEFVEYGTTIPFLVPGEGEYRAVWAGPKQGKSYGFRAKAMEGKLDMVTREGESEMKWCLTGIGEVSFEWGKWIREEGGEWWVREEFSCRRMK